MSINGQYESSVKKLEKALDDFSPFFQKLINNDNDFSTCDIDSDMQKAIELIRSFFYIAK